MKPFGPSSEDERLRQAELDALELDAFETTAFDDLIRLAADAFQAPMATISIIDGDRRWVKAKVGLSGPVGGPRENSFAAHVVDHAGELLIVEDATQDARFATNPFVTGAPHIRFYAAAPLTLASGRALGAICVMDTTPRSADVAKLAQLKFLADQVVQTLEARAQAIAARRNA